MQTSAIWFLCSEMISQEVWRIPHFVERTEKNSCYPSILHLSHSNGGGPLKTGSLSRSCCRAHFRGLSRLLLERDPGLPRRNPRWGRSPETAPGAAPGGGVQVPLHRTLSHLLMKGVRDLGQQGRSPSWLVPDDLPHGKHMPSLVFGS